MKSIFYTLIVFFCSMQMAYAQCIDNTHSTLANQGWYSCQTSIAPIAERGDVHWVQFDLGHNYVLDTMHIWNYNEWGKTKSGAKSIMLDYSTNGSDWVAIGPIALEKATGSWKYTGSTAVVLDSIAARYILVSVVDTWGNNDGCAGISELRWNVLDIDVSTIEENSEVIMSISPNPADDYVRITWPSSVHATQIEIYDAVGRLMLSQSTHSIEQWTVPVHTWETGVYHVSILSKEGISSQRFIKI